MVIPHQHVENLFDLPLSLAVPLQLAAQDAAFAMVDRIDAPGLLYRRDVGWRAP